MPHAHTEEHLVEQPAIGLFAELGWAVAGAPPNDGVAGGPRDAGLLGRGTKGGAGLVSRLRDGGEADEFRGPANRGHGRAARGALGVAARSAEPGDGDSAGEIVARIGGACGRLRAEKLSGEKRRATGWSQWPSAERVVPFQSRELNTTGTTARQAAIQAFPALKRSRLQARRRPSVWVSDRY